MSDHHLVEVPTDGRSPDRIAGELWERRPIGIEERPDRLIAAFADPALALRVASELGGTVVVAPPPDHTAWHEDLRVTEVAGFAIHPPWLAPPAGAVGISIDPGPSFGTGTHPSTRVALRWLARMVRPGMDVADVGTGSGILAVAAARLGARVTAVDIDPAAARAARRNIRANLGRHTPGVVVLDGSVEMLTPPIDLAVVNVTVDVHERIGPEVAALGVELVIAAGVLAHQTDRTRRAYGTAGSARLADGEWVGLRLDL